MVFGVILWDTIPQPAACAYCCVSCGLRVLDLCGGYVHSRNQIVTGLSLTILGSGFANFIGKEYSMLSLTAEFKNSFDAFVIPALANIPLIGPALFNQSILVHLALLIAVVTYFYIFKTRYGLNLRSVGENPAAADASGIKVLLYKYVHIMIGGGLCGLGGAFLSLDFISSWQENITAGLGWIAVALVIFATWNPLKAIFGAYFFGALRALVYKLQNLTIPFTDITIAVPTQLLAMLPYLATIIVLIVAVMKKKRKNLAPAWLGSAYFREER